jgi:shikimate dehydrogenase
VLSPHDLFDELHENGSNTVSPVTVRHVLHQAGASPLIPCLAIHSMSIEFLELASSDTCRYACCYAVKDLLGTSERGVWLLTTQFSVRGNRAKLLLGLIGSGIQGSRSPVMHMREAEAHGLDCVYQLIDTEQLKLDADALPDLLTSAERMGFAGVNVTYPFKQAVIPYLTDVSKDARALGAVNTVVLQDGRRFGQNTDWLPGRSIERIVQLGAGGAGAATAYGMLKMAAAHVTLIDLDPVRSTRLAERLGAIFGVDRISISSDLAGSLEGANGLIHATPVGMTGHPGMALPASLLRRDLWVAEIVYFPLETELLRTARNAGCATVDGSWMAVYQAAKAFEFFTGLESVAERMHEFFVGSLRAV